ncbi:MAG: ABC-F family ATP-binding cassette domain-containing protein [Cuneatibacter sp.]|nr:ABC-F family ATP-binding cassette domain-containing protein [Cuneatibacter sp.]
MIVTVEHLKKSFTDKPLLSDVSFYLNEGEKVGIIGQNGCGKSTFLRILAGKEHEDDGRVIYGNHVVISYLPQDPEFPEDDTLLNGVLSMCRKEDAVWDLEAQAKSMLNRLELTDFSQPCGQLSGGQKKRAALVAALLAPADVLILDEPTNHLDAGMVEWLEQYLKGYRGAVVMITHDRYFLDSVTTRIVEIFRGEAFSYDSNYSGFLEKKAERAQTELVQEQRRKNLYRQELAWVRRGARARTTKQKARLERFEELAAKKMPEQEESAQFQAATTRMGRTTIELDHLCKSYGDRVLIRDFTYIFGKRDRVGIIGPNGCGKTTLMKMICGMEQPDSGTVTIGQTITIGYYSQMFSTDPADGIAYMDPNRRVIDYIRDTAEYVRVEGELISASRMLERFLFSGDKQYSLIGKLSGGEKRRLNLLRVLMQAPNVLILDEPTNDLDITTLTILEDYLDEFDGIVLTVSHDRYFLDRIVQRIFAFEEDGKLQQYEGGYTDYYWKQQERAEKESEQVTPTKNTDRGEKPSEKTWKQREKKLKLTWQEQKDYEVIEEEIAALEEQVSELETAMVRAGSDYVKLRELQEQKDATEVALEEKMDRWTYLEERMEEIRAQNLEK